MKQLKFLLAEEKRERREAVMEIRGEREREKGTGRSEETE